MNEPRSSGVSLNRSSIHDSLSRDALSFLADASEQLATTLDPGHVVQMLARLAVPEIADWCVVFGPRDGDAHAVLATAHADPDRDAQIRDLLHPGLPASEFRRALFAMAEGDNTALLMEPLDTIRSTFALSPELERTIDRLGAREAIVVPLNVAGGWRGVMILVVASDARTLDNHALTIVHEITRRGCNALQNAFLYRNATAEADRQAEARKRMGEDLASVLDSLRKIEVRVRRLFDANVIGILFGDLDGNIIETNSAFLRLLGYTHDDLGEHRINLIEITPSEHLDASRRALEQVAALGVCTPYEKEYFRKDGSRVPVMVGIVLLEGAQNLTAAFVLDLTERKQAEMALIESERRQAALLDAIPDMIFRLRADGTFIDYVGSDRNMLALSPAEFLDRPIFEVLPREVAELSMRHIDLALRSGALQVYEYELPLAGEMRQYEARLLVSGADEVIGIVRDITDRKESERILRSSESHMRALIENSWDAIALIGLDGILRFASPAATRILGYEVEELIGLNIFDLMHPDDIPSTVAMFGQLLLKPGSSFTAQYRNRHKNGSWRWIDGTGTNLLEEPSVGAIVANFRDITEQKEAESELKMAKEAAEAANAAKDRFLAVLSHELRTPLTPVLSAVEALCELDGFTSDIEVLVQIIRRNVELEARLIDDLLDLTRIAKGKLQLSRATVDLRTVITNVLEICGPEAAAKGISIDVHLDAEGSHVDGDSGRLQQVFWNLVQNAVKFTPEKGVITIRSEDAAADRVRLTVSDTGIGIEEYHLARIFNAFEQGEETITRRFGGLGLGLTISRTLVALHGGTLTAQSEGLNRGTTFIVELPTVAPELVRGDSGDEEPIGRPGAAIHILLVDDHRDTNVVMRLLLERHGYRVTIAESVRTAIEAIGQERFDLLISDIGLPDGSGLDIMRELRRRGSIRGIALSGFGMEQDIARSREAGFEEHLVKPISLQRLIEVIRAMSGA